VASHLAALEVQKQASVRVLERQVHTSDGGTAVSQLEIGFTQHCTLTTEDQKMFCLGNRVFERP
jgi:hypothetical protein